MSAKQIQNCKDKVEQVLKVSTISRENDSILWWNYVKDDLENLMGSEATWKLREYLLNKNNPKVDNLGRIRRKFQEVGLYESENQKAKRREADKVQEVLGYA
jgi:hypothetical protein